MALTEIELRPRFRPANASYNPGGKINGDREIWINGEHWLNAIMSQHGVHGSRHTLEYADGGELVDNPEAKRLRSVVIESWKWRRRNVGPEKQHLVLKQYDAIVIKVRELLDAGKLESPGDRAARRVESAARYRANRDAEQAERARMLEGVYSLRDRNDLTDAERLALAWLYNEVFAAPLPFPEGRPHD